MELNIQSLREIEQDLLKERDSATITAIIIAVITGIITGFFILAFRDHQAIWIKLLETIALMVFAPSLFFSITYRVKIEARLEYIKQASR